MLAFNRYGQSSWASPSGVILFGGFGAGFVDLATSLRIEEDGTTTESFKLNYNIA